MGRTDQLHHPAVIALDGATRFGRHDAGAEPAEPHRLDVLKQRQHGDDRIEPDETADAGDEPAESANGDAG